MRQDIKFKKTIEYFYNSLADSIGKRIKQLGVTREDVLHSDPTRVTDIVKNRRNKNHPYLIGEREYSKIYNIFKFNTKEEVSKQGLNHNEFIKEVKEFGRDKKTGKMKTIKKKKFFDPNNYDNMLWGHIDWEKLFLCIMEDIQALDSDDELHKVFEQSLLDYVPYSIDYADYEISDSNPFSNFFLAKPPVYAPIEVESLLTGKLEIENDLVFGDEIFNQLEDNKRKAIDWVYLKEKSAIIRKLKNEFLAVFSGKRLQKFNQKFDFFLLEFMSRLTADKLPKHNSFGIQAYNYMKELLEGELANEQADFSYITIESYRPEDWCIDEEGNFYPDYSDVGEVREIKIDVLANYIQFAKNHLQRLQKFQLEFERVRKQT
ncbi:hypothetical protein [Lactobacillus sp. UCMA15818]|uniref:hypothetical protein n=1 Tax=Lactobacillus sp. UCMA15818 TaxID=2583394 RepID=UPI0025AF0397|nr:hypothetical protein [Lactobacillus sp. UCMA15818]MDN2454121.1 hypothetical protein [Lactobacillus sp. UCMA15818]